MFVAEYRNSFRVVQLERRVAEDLKPKGMCAAPTLNVVFKTLS